MFAYSPKKSKPKKSLKAKQNLFDITVNKENVTQDENLGCLKLDNIDSRSVLADIGNIDTSRNHFKSPIRNQVSITKTESDVFIPKPMNIKVNDEVCPPWYVFEDNKNKNLSPRGRTPNKTTTPYRRSPIKSRSRSPIARDHSVPSTPATPNKVSKLRASSIPPSPAKNDSRAPLLFGEIMIHTISENGLSSPKYADVKLLTMYESEVCLVYLMFTWTINIKQMKASLTSCKSNFHRLFLLPHCIINQLT